MASSVGLQLPPDGGAGNSRDSLRSLAPIPWSFSLSDLTADLSNLGGNFLFVLNGNYHMIFCYMLMQCDLCYSSLMLHHFYPCVKQLYIH